MLFRKRHPKIGARPGTLMINAEAPAPKIVITTYSPDRVERTEVADTDQLESSLDPDSVNWVDIQGFGDEEMIRRVGELFQLPPLILEDIVNIPQRPKSENFDGQLLLVMRMVQADHQGLPNVEQVSIVLGGHYVLTFQEWAGDVFGSIRKRIRSQNGRHRRSEADYLFYTLVDAIVDGYYPVLEGIGDHLQALEDMIFQRPDPSSLRLLNSARMQLLNLRRSMWPQRDALHELAHETSPLLRSEVQTQLRDVYDHCIQTSEVIDMYREMASGLMSTYLSSVANRTNDIMKVLTMMGSVFIPLTFLAGIYGMNFQNMPELKIPWAYPLLWGVMIVSAGSMLWFFYRKGWLSSDRETPPDDPA